MIRLVWWLLGIPFHLEEQRKMAWNAKLLGAIVRAYR